MTRSVRQEKAVRCQAGRVLDGLQHLPNVERRVQWNYERHGRIIALGESDPSTAAKMLNAIDGGDEDAVNALMFTAHFLYPWYTSYHSPRSGSHGEEFVTTDQVHPIFVTTFHCKAQNDAAFAPLRINFRLTFDTISVHFPCVATSPFPGGDPGGRPACRPLQVHVWGAA